MKITTKAELLEHIEQHKGQDVPLFTTLGRHHMVLDETLKSHKKIEIKKHKHSDSEFIFLDGDAYYSLMDRHLLGDQDYNDNWWFTTRKEAEDYARIHLRQ